MTSSVSKDSRSRADISYSPLPSSTMPPSPPSPPSASSTLATDAPIVSDEQIEIQIDDDTGGCTPVALTSNPVSRSSSRLTSDSGTSIPPPIASDSDLCSATLTSTTGAIAPPVVSSTVVVWDEEGEGDQCRICHCETPAPNESGDHEPMITPCSCAGSLKYVHQTCLQQWIKSADTKSCELCKYNFHMTTKLKPFRKWNYLQMTSMERRKIMCSVIFHAIAITCVIWSLYVLIDRTSDEIKNGSLQWPFWTKLLVVAIGFTGGLVFMYVQCRTYTQLCKRWRAYNRIVYVQNAPAKPSKTAAAAPVTIDDGQQGGGAKIECIGGGGGGGVGGKNDSVDEIEVL